ncbi:MAG: PAS domain S-box protein, partial [Ignavibacteria bacterium]
MQNLGWDWHFVMLLMGPVILSLFYFEKREYIVSLIIFLLTDVSTAYINQGLNYNSLLNMTMRLLALIAAGEVVVHHKKNSSLSIKKLQKSEQRFKNLLNYSYDWEYFIDTGGRIEYSSPSCIFQTQYSAEEFIKNPKLLLDIVAEEDLEAVKKHYEGELTGEQQKPIQFKIYKKNGDYRIIRHTCSPVQENGKFIGVRVTNRNATDRWNSEQKLKEREKKYRYIFENLVDVYYRTSIDGKIELVSPSVEKISGYKVKELVGKNAAVLYADPEGREKFIELIMKQGELKNYETKFKDKNGDIKILSFNNKLIYENGKPVG